MTDFDLDRFEVLTFDCYGTLIDWESGILAEVRPILAARRVAVDDEEILERYAVQEAAAEGSTYRPYRVVLAASVRALAAELGASITDAEATAFSASVPRWPPFPDSAEALQKLATRYRLGVITNCDSDLLAASAQQLDARFDWVITAEQVRAYKPSLVPFRRALEMSGVPPDRILHAAQSLYHDHVPAKQLGLATVWVNRRHDRSGFGATPPAAATPDWVVADLRSLAAMAVG